MDLSSREELIPVELVQKGDKIKVMRVTMVKLHYCKQLALVFKFRKDAIHT